ncbi:MAG: hypothetical protein Q4E05_12315, partial [Pseudoclavibacter sp.]|nr:hypothetical protein [Pseudoclavibacter sp.]
MQGRRDFGDRVWAALEHGALTLLVPGQPPAAAGRAVKAGGVLAALERLLRPRGFSTVPEFVLVERREDHALLILRGRVLAASLDAAGEPVEANGLSPLTWTETAAYADIELTALAEDGSRSPDGWTVPLAAQSEEAAAAQEGRGPEEGHGAEEPLELAPGASEAVESGPASEPEAAEESTSGESRADGERRAERAGTEAVRTEADAEPEIERSEDGPEPGAPAEAGDISADAVESAPGGPEPDGPVSEPEAAAEPEALAEPASEQPEVRAPETEGPERAGSEAAEPEPEAAGSED